MIRDGWEIAARLGHVPLQARRLAGRGLILAAVAALMASGCTSSGTSGSSSGSTAGPKLVAQVPLSRSAQLTRPGYLTFCSDFPSPPQEFYTAGGAAVGSDVATGNAIASMLGLRPQWVNSVFDTIIEAVTGGKCDVIISGMFITPPRAAQIYLIPYLNSGEQLLVSKGNPQHISDDPASLCGKTVSTELGAAEAITLKQWSAKCKAAGHPAIAISVPPKTDSALQEVQTGHASAFFEDSPVTGYYAAQQPSVFQLVSPVPGRVEEGIGISHANKALETAVFAAIKKLEADGRYHAILSRWGLLSLPVPQLRNPAAQGS